ncbi:MAG: quinolinate synthase NadA [Algoriphagus sp.]|nr:quinolinate synthase NadA [Algoriphagus sp.]
MNDRKRWLTEQIDQLRRKKNAVILAHYYQNQEIQDVADFVGDSLDLSRKAVETSAEIIVFAGVHFMAETAKILNPDKKVLLPDLEAGCSLADSGSTFDYKIFLELHSDCVSVAYINSSAEIKAQCDYVCTSSNAAKIIQSIPENRKIVFLPDKNLGKYLIQKTGREMILWDGACAVHEAFSVSKLMSLVLAFPKAKILAHPESSPAILRLANFVGSTSALLRYVTENESEEFLIGTEAGILHQMHLAAPNKTIIPIPTEEDNTCACSECAFMKVNTLEKLYQCLLHESPEITLDPEIGRKALKPIQRMLDLA